MVNSWENFSKHLIHNEKLGISLDFSGMGMEDSFFKKIEPKVAKAYKDMSVLESGGIANVDENRQVGHYWLRNPSIAPTPEIGTLIESTIKDIRDFSQDVHYGNIRGQGGNFKNILCIGIGGSALGPQLLYTTLATTPKLRVFFIDNTDPDGIDTVLNELSDQLDRTLVVVTSKSGSTPEPRNAMFETMHVYAQNNISFPKQAVAITVKGSKLYDLASREGWVRTFPMFEWVGGRTSVTSSVGLLPAALAGIDIKSFLSGAKDMDTWTRIHSPQNPAMMLALAWYFATDGRGTKDMVIIPYKDRLSNFSKYLQQLIMESLGKEKDLNGNIINQGIAVYGNKGSTDQHSYIQQLRDGVNNFFATIIEVLTPRSGNSIEIEPDITSGDYLHGFSIGTEQAISSNNRQTIVITINKCDAYSLGMLIALYERAVGYYASMIGINAYHQPGVEAGKKAAANVLNLQKSILSLLKKNDKKPLSLSQIFAALNLPDDAKKTAFKILEQLSVSRPELKRTFSEHSLEENIYT
ncbi:MAG: glucose-6-phosphate isomerase, partial [Opitutales bacterium]|nr:glucose-6-phosphate isomerase [Opitutales bacterium]